MLRGLAVCSEQERQVLLDPAAVVLLVVDLVLEVCYPFLEVGGAALMLALVVDRLDALPVGSFGVCLEFIGHSGQTEVLLELSDVLADLVHWVGVVLLHGRIRPCSELGVAVGTAVACLA